MTTGLAYNGTVLGRYRETTATSTVFVHKQKRCECGRATTAKQLTQYGKCTTCCRAKP